MNDRKICIIGAGTMGSGIAQVAAQSGINVILYDKDSSCIDKGINIIEKNLQKAIEKEKIKPEDKGAILARIKKVLKFEDCFNDNDFIIEAVVEDIQVKKSLFRQLDEKCKPEETILATNTSSLSVTEIASVTEKPNRVIGIHFFNPVQVMNLVEIVRGKKTSNDVFLRSKEFVEKLGKTPIEVKDYPGFVVNRLLIPMINEAANILADGVSSKEEIDMAMKLGANHPLGPLALADLIGLDVCLNIMQTLYDGFSDPKYKPSPLIISMVAAGLLGRKNKKGFYEYS